MASLRQGCGDLRGLVSTFTQSCQCSLSEARGQVRTICSLSGTHSLGSLVTVRPWGTPYSFSSPQGAALCKGGGRCWNQNSL